MKTKAKAKANKIKRDKQYLELIFSGIFETYSTRKSWRDSDPCSKHFEQPIVGVNVCLCGNDTKFFSDIWFGLQRSLILVIFKHKFDKLFDLVSNDLNKVVFLLLLLLKLSFCHIHNTDRPNAHHEWLLYCKVLSLKQQIKIHLIFIHFVLFPLLNCSRFFFSSHFEFWFIMSKINVSMVQYLFSHYHWFIA